MRIVTLIKTLLRLIRKPSRWKYTSRGYCPVCDQNAWFVCNLDTKKGIANLISTWDSGARFKQMLIERENHFCCYCQASVRIRSHANCVLNLMRLSSAGQLIKALTDHADFRIFETAAYNVFRNARLRELPNYVVSEYREKGALGVPIDGVRNENLESLTLPENTFDIVLTSDVLEHVADLDKALSEIKRVLKPGGRHIFTIPVDQDLPETKERARIKGGQLEHLMKPVMHGDSIRAEGILAFRDFGADVLHYLTREGLACKEWNYEVPGKFVASVYYSQKASAAILPLPTG